MISGARNAENKELKIYELQHELVQHLPLFKVKDESLFLFILNSTPLQHSRTICSFKPLVPLDFECLASHPFPRH